MDAFPGYTYFDKSKKVLCVIQIVDETKAPKPNTKSVMAHGNDESFDLDENGIDDNRQLDSDSYNGKAPTTIITLKDLTFTTGKYEKENNVVRVANGGSITEISVTSASVDGNGWTPSVDNANFETITEPGTYKVTINYTNTDTTVISKTIPFRVEFAEA